MNIPLNASATKRWPFIASLPAQQPEACAVVAPVSVGSGEASLQRGEVFPACAKLFDQESVCLADGVVQRVELGCLVSESADRLGPVAGCDSLELLADELHGSDGGLLRDEALRLECVREVKKALLGVREWWAAHGAQLSGVDDAASPTHIVQAFRRANPELAAALAALRAAA